MAEIRTCFLFTDVRNLLVIDLFIIHDWQIMSVGILMCVKVKVKFSPEQATKAQRGSRCIALLFLQPRRYMGVGGQRYALAPLPPVKTRYPLYRRLGGPQGRSGRVRKIPPPTAIRSPDRPARSESLYRLRFPGPILTCVGRYSNELIKLIII